MPSIKQNLIPICLPDFRSLSVALRLILGTNLMMLVTALLQSSDCYTALLRLIDLAAWVEPLLFASLLLLAALRDLLLLWPKYMSVSLSIAIPTILTFVFTDSEFVRNAEISYEYNALRNAFLVAGLCIFFGVYFSLYTRACAPALAEARLQALTARIRPHFLFNTLNAVLSLIRSEPKRAENALEELAELYRALMRDTRELVLLSDELSLCRHYLGLERLRLGDRLSVQWEMSDIPGETRIPALMLQPLLENAVYHGVERSSLPGTIRIRFSRRDKQLLIELSNPCDGHHTQHQGNRMALANIRERLRLYYDWEARLTTHAGNGTYEVSMSLPCRS